MTGTLWWLIGVGVAVLAGWFGLLVWTTHRDGWR